MVSLRETGVRPNKEELLKELDKDGGKKFRGGGEMTSKLKSVYVLKPAS